MKASEFFSGVAGEAPLSGMDPRLAEFLREYLSAEKVVSWRRQRVINTHFPPYPGPAFDQMARMFTGEAPARRLYSVTVAVTNRCGFKCWHCYNAGRSCRDLSSAALKSLAAELQERGAALVTLTGGEPLLRDDLEAVCAAFDARTCVNVGTTGWGLTSARARALKRAGVFAMGISLDSQDAAEHDRLRGRAGAFAVALRALQTAGHAGLYPYVVSVGTREFLRRDRFFSFLEFAGRAGAMEVHLLEPSATGRLQGRGDLLLDAAHRRRILGYQREVAGREELPVLSTFTYLESPCAFGCGAGLTHLYVDGSGEVCPCNLVPLSFGNIRREPLGRILERMGGCFSQPRPECVGRRLGPHLPPGSAPASPAVSLRLCREHLPARHALPRFFALQKAVARGAGAPELRRAYDRIHGDYESFWVARAGRPVRRLVRDLALRGAERVFEAGCGSGYGTALLAAALSAGGSVEGVDLSAGMLDQARRRLEAAGARNAALTRGDALKALSARRRLDAVFTSWALGYIPLRPFFTAAARALRPGGRLAFLVHLENSPREQLALFARVVAERPGALTRRVAFDFPRSHEAARQAVLAAGLTPLRFRQGRVLFRYRTAEEVLEHLLKSGAGTVFHDAIAPRYRARLRRRFVELQRPLRDAAGWYAVEHRYVAGTAEKEASHVQEPSGRRRRAIGSAP
jgi:MoaA/NifB/PqqE/SkfB family radical SAM enzyme/protein-L-isoaspartate O-methyltransferase